MELSPKLADAHARIGTLCLSLSRGPEAIRALHRASVVAPQSDLGRLALAKAYTAEEQQGDAEQVLRRMLARSPDHFDARKMLGDVLSFPVSSNRLARSTSARSVPAVSRSAPITA